MKSELSTCQGDAKQMIETLFLSGVSFINCYKGTNNYKRLMHDFLKKLLKEQI